MARLVLVITGDRWWGRPAKSPGDVDADELRVAEQRITMWRALRDVDERHDDVEIVVGRAKGADTLAEQIGETLGWIITPFEPDWNGSGFYRPQAGPERNQRMVDYGSTMARLADVRTHALVFHDDLGSSRGTKDCLRRISSAGIPFEVLLS